ncbi:NAD(P)-binding Rossmann-fold superfamily protein [Prunus dulcis]|uniref:NAD(P)-binding Rossmann-fold superfamily protein n=1 Tax=Prunus dulcis TaxID=3755 RepID=A0A4Y1QR99_PRUDU|nr:NAD(P)-binding Rossmann-fold superfamily protein [Prunus dulcis]
MNQLDIMYVTSLLSRFMQNPSQMHYGATKRILRYLQGTINHGIWYKPTTDPRLFGYTKSDWAGPVDDMKSTSGYAFTIGSEVQYVVVASTTCQAIWLKRIFEDIGECQTKATEILCDNKSDIVVVKNLVFHIRTKHIAIKHHFLREVSANKEVELKYCKTEEQIADIFTKAIPRPKFKLLRNMFGIT